MNENINISEDNLQENISPVVEDNFGNIKISIDVVATITGIATAEINGVASMYSTLGGIAEILSSKKNPTKGVKVEMNENSVVIDIYIIVDYGVRIPELAWEVQENVKNNIETMTGLNVEKVNIHVEGVSFAKEKNKEDVNLPIEEPVIVDEVSIDEISNNESDLLL